MPRNQPEFRLTVAVANLLRFAARPGVYWTHLPFGEARSERTGARLKRMGTRAGAADFLIVKSDDEHKGRAIFLELKADKGRQNQAQRDTELEFTLAGGMYKCCRGYSEAFDFLEMIEVIRPAREVVRFAPREKAAA